MDLEQSARSPGSMSSNFSGRSQSYPRTSLVTLSGIPRYPSLTAPAHPRSAPSYIERPAGQQQPWFLGQLELLLLASALLGNIQRRGRVTLLASTFSMW